MAENHHMKESEILGPVLAHEIGHLLGAAHSPMGVMCSQFSRGHIALASVGELLFPSAQAAGIRVEVARRQSTSKAD
jgi:hypothetical protein